jgi:hypothetical protein
MARWAPPCGRCGPAREPRWHGGAAAGQHNQGPRVLGGAAHPGLELKHALARSKAGRALSESWCQPPVSTCGSGSGLEACGKGARLQDCTAASRAARQPGRAPAAGAPSRTTAAHPDQVLQPVVAAVLLEAPALQPPVLLIDLDPHARAQLLPIAGFPRALRPMRPTRPIMPSWLTVYKEPCCEPRRWQSARAR